MPSLPSIAIVGGFTLLKVLDNVEHADISSEDHTGEPKEEDEEVLPELPLAPGLLFSGVVRFHGSKLSTL